jgi:hypothetical protein
VCDLAEAGVGQRLTASGDTSGADEERFWQIKQRLSENRLDDEWTRWGRWFVADRAKRTICPESPVTIMEYIRTRVEGGSLAKLREAWRLSPTNGLALARLTRGLVASPTKLTAGQSALLDFYSRRALELSPYHSEAWRARAEWLQRIGDTNAALAALERASECQP